ncbi:MAG: hypothetical protein IH804_05860, partial [Planctomycetes bacterium]|nr:hypothetical protein [Planctomycetota bacterium]
MGCSLRRASPDYETANRAAPANTLTRISPGILARYPWRDATPRALEGPGSSRMYTLLQQLSLAAAVALGPGVHGQTEPADTLPAAQSEIERLPSQSEALRLELATARMELAKARKELDELRQFILDHHQYGDAFDQYTKIRSLAESDARRRQTQALQERQAAREAERAARRQAAMEKRRHDQAEQRRLARYRKAGLRPIGLDVFAG